MTTAKFKRKCGKCGGTIEVGMPIEQGADGWSHAGGCDPNPQSEGFAAQNHIDPKVKMIAPDDDDDWAAHLNDGEPDDDDPWTDDIPSKIFKVSDVSAGENSFASTSKVIVQRISAWSSVEQGVVVKPGATVPRGINYVPVHLHDGERCPCEVCAEIRDTGDPWAEVVPSKPSVTSTIRTQRKLPKKRRH